MTLVIQNGNKVHPRGFVMRQSSSYPLEVSKEEEGHENGWNIGAVKKSYNLLQLALGQAVQHFFTYITNQGAKHGPPSEVLEGFFSRRIQSISVEVRRSKNLDPQFLEWFGIGSDNYGVVFFNKLESLLAEYLELSAFSLDSETSKIFERQGRIPPFAHERAFWQTLQEGRERIANALGVRPQVISKDTEERGQDARHEVETSLINTLINWRSINLQEHRSLVSEIDLEFAMWLLLLVPETNSFITYVGRKTSEHDISLPSVDSVSLNEDSKKFLLLFYLIRFIREVSENSEDINQKDLSNKGSITNVVSGKEFFDFLLSQGIVIQKDELINLFSSFCSGRNHCQSIETLKINKNVVYRLYGMYALFYMFYKQKDKVLFAHYVPDLAVNVFKDIFEVPGLNIIGHFRSMVIAFARILLLNLFMLAEYPEKLKYEKGNGKSAINIQEKLKPEVRVTTGIPKEIFKALESIVRFLVQSKLIGSEVNLFDLVEAEGLFNKGFEEETEEKASYTYRIHQIFKNALENHIPENLKLTSVSLATMWEMLFMMSYRASRGKEQAFELMKGVYRKWIKLQAAYFGITFNPEELELPNNINSDNFWGLWLQHKKQELCNHDNTDMCREFLAGLLYLMNLFVGALIYIPVGSDNYLLASFQTIPDLMHIVYQTNGEANAPQHIDNFPIVSQMGHGFVVGRLGNTFLDYLLRLQLDVIGGRGVRHGNIGRVSVILQENKLVIPEPEKNKVVAMQMKRIGLLLLLAYLYTRKPNETFYQWISNSNCQFWQLVRMGYIKFIDLTATWFGGIPNPWEMRESNGTHVSGEMSSELLGSIWPEVFFRNLGLDDLQNLVRGLQDQLAIVVRNHLVEKKQVT